MLNQFIFGHTESLSDAMIKVTLDIKNPFPIFEYGDDERLIREIYTQKESNFLYSEEPKLQESNFPAKIIFSHNFGYDNKTALQELDKIEIPQQINQGGGLDGWYWFIIKEGHCYKGWCKPFPFVRQIEKILKFDEILQYCNKVLWNTYRTVRCHIKV